MEKLVTANLNIIIPISLRYQNKGLPLEKLIGAGKSN